MNDEGKNSQVRVFVIDDSAFMRTSLSRMISSDLGLRVVGTAANGNDALQRIPALDPDVITLDMEMPGLNGLETLKRIMNEHPRPVIMVSSVMVNGAEITFRALAAGAFDYLPKNLPSGSLDISHVRDNLVAKIKAAAESRNRSRPRPVARKPPHSAHLPKRQRSSLPAEIVAIGISTGGPQALQEILPLFPADLPVPIIVVQHMPKGFTAPYAKRLDSLCAVTVREASQREVVQPGVVYIAPAGAHLVVERSNLKTSICLTEEPSGLQHIPSIDVMMHSVAAAWGPLTMGVIMTGMASDGSQGMEAIYREGGLTVGQDEETCAVYGMPRLCAEMGILDRVVPLMQIPQEIVQASRRLRAGVGAG
jgi:two-component system, chemotaxis family, protein-glutamate methylesterase/glutaminase